MIMPLYININIYISISLGCQIRTLVTSIMYKDFHRVTMLPEFEISDQILRHSLSHIPSKIKTLIYRLPL